MSQLPYSTDSGVRVLSIPTTAALPRSSYQPRYHMQLRAVRLGATPKLASNHRTTAHANYAGEAQHSAPQGNQRSWKKGPSHLKRPKVIVHSIQQFS
ncbi:hypothetical protein N7508_004174 [Penicillium antarcticum]|uniref:uncharacterized protein n=1 Tax=Penicillium antarcticum TaxID=416450 RepID=UPI002385C36C|nr:uncharacterized protein N7508_004174 [Penicillium antarcticum]KAJ5308795.1 hypothetical protein N7508_004174 [Penicillium antarcticum]